MEWYMTSDATLCCYKMICHAKHYDLLSIPRVNERIVGRRFVITIFNNCYWTLKKHWKIGVEFDDCAHWVPTKQNIKNFRNCPTWSKCMIDVSTDRCQCWWAAPVEIYTPCGTNWLYLSNRWYIIEHKLPPI